MVVIYVLYRAHTDQNFLQDDHLSVTLLASTDLTDENTGPLPTTVVSPVYFLPTKLPFIEQVCIRSVVIVSMGQHFPSNFTHSFPSMRSAFSQYF